MLTNKEELIEQEIFKEHLEQCNVKVRNDSEARFSIEVSFDGFSMGIAGSDARVCLKLPLSTFDLPLKNILLLSVCNAEGEVANNLAPYKLTLWKNDRKDFKKTPDFSSLEVEENLFIDICTGPCDISTNERAYKQVISLLMKVVRWILSNKLIHEDEMGELEGERHQYLSSKVERSKINRALCLAIYGFECQICNEKMEDKYGVLAEEFIHVHHIESIAESGVHWVNPQKDLIPICPNCHSMVHRNTPPLSPQQLKEILIRTKKEST